MVSQLVEGNARLISKRWRSPRKRYISRNEKLVLSLRVHLDRRVPLNQNIFLFMNQLGARTESKWSLSLFSPSLWLWGGYGFRRQRSHSKWVNRKECSSRSIKPHLVFSFCCCCCRRRLDYLLPIPNYDGTVGTSNANVWHKSVCATVRDRHVGRIPRTDHRSISHCQEPWTKVKPKFVHFALLV